MTTLLVIMCLNAPLPLRPSGQVIGPGDYLLKVGDASYGLSLASSGEYTLRTRSEVVRTGEWTLNGRRLTLEWGRLDAGGLPPGRKVGFHKADLIDLTWSPSDRVWHGRGWDDGDQEYKNYELRRAPR